VPEYSLSMWEQTPQFHLHSNVKFTGPFIFFLFVAIFSLESTADKAMPRLKQSPVSRCEGPHSIPGQAIWDLCGQSGAGRGFSLSPSVF
jgi:hypothetical protein